jgi:hypothetical protein
MQNIAHYDVIEDGAITKLRHSKQLISVATIARPTQEQCFFLLSTRLETSSQNRKRDRSGVFCAVRAYVV